VGNVIGRRISNFRIVAQLGAGGMGEVFLAEHEKIGTRVAIKMLQPHISANTEHVQRFFNEAIAVSKIQHAGVAKIFDDGLRAGSRVCLVMGSSTAGRSLRASGGSAGDAPNGSIAGRCERVEAVTRPASRIAI
jgi:hypothetical protein